LNASIDFEISLLRLLEKATNGTVIEISVTGKRRHNIRPSGHITERFHSGTAILLKPGVILGGKLSHECPLSRSVGYFLEPIIMLAPFAKKPFELTLHGITTDDKDLSVRHILEVSNGNSVVV